MGTNFVGVNAVAFNGIATSAFTVNSPTQITVIVPAAATTGLIRLSTQSGMAVSTIDFSVTTTPVPVITSFSPASGTFASRS